MGVVAQILKHRSLNGWALFLLIVLPLSATVLFEASGLDLSDPRNISALLQLSVRLAVPWLYLAFAASALAAVYPGVFSRWLLRNRRIIGLCFAAGMAWQLLFICWMVFGHWTYYLAEAYSVYDLAEQLPGYVVLFAMTATSFAPVRKKLTPTQWRVLHKGGIYFLWAVVWSTYWFALFYYTEAQIIDHVFYWAGFGAWGLRVMAWARKRRVVAAPRHL
ncbi:MAG: hypothetical protein ACKO4A_07910 [Gammaproteobacteria bacterium]